MHICIVTGEYPPMAGGVGAYTQALAHAVTDAGNRVSILTRQQCKNDVPGMPVYNIIAGKWDWHTLQRIRNWVSENSPDIINIQFQTAAYDMMPAIHLLPRIIRTVPVVVTFHDLREPYLFPKAHWLGLRNLAVRYLALSADGAITTERDDEVNLRRWGVKAVRRIPIGSNISVQLPVNFDRDSNRRAYGIPPDMPALSYFGFLNQSKGALDLVSALQILHTAGIPAHLIMIGGVAGASDPTDIDYGQRVFSAIERAGLEDFIHWTGYVSDPEVSAWFMSSDIAVLPFTDGVSLRRGTLMAALAHGRTIITTAAENLPAELDGAVYTVTPGRAAEIATAVQTLWADRAEMARLEQAALQASGYFTWDHIAGETLHFFDELTGR